MSFLPGHRTDLDQASLLFHRENILFLSYFFFLVDILPDFCQILKPVFRKHICVSCNSFIAIPKERKPIIKCCLKLLFIYIYIDHIDPLTCSIYNFFFKYTFCSLFYSVSAKYSCGFSIFLVSSIIVDEKYLDYFNTITEDRL